ncbi:MAG: hypothetical protein GC201_13705 [Alphaproteobacteria bacterium]|nr:hypothetical protein [Alphaproteobacteria bacterium]
MATTLSGGCATQIPSKQHERDVNELVAAFRAETKAVKEREEVKENEEVKRLSVTRETVGGKTRFLVSADLTDALLTDVVERLLKETQVSYNMSGTRLSGTVTARFTDLDLAAALNEMLNPQGLSVVWRNNILVFRYGVPVSDGTAAGDGASAASAATPASDDAGEGKGGSVESEVDLKYVTAKDGLALLQGLYPEGKGVTYGALPNLNAIYLSGTRQAVSEARTALLRADREVPHVFIEMLVVDLDTIATKKLGAKLTEGSKGDFSNINILPGSTEGNIGFTLIDGLKSATQLTLMVDLLATEDNAEILSRPYIATRSDQPASIEIVTDQYVAVQKSVEGASVTTTDGISAGVILNVTPVVLADGMIRLDLSVEASTFSPALAGSLVTKERNKATTTVSVPSGQTVVIGGLNFSRRATSQAGIPGLRNIPGVNLAAQNETSGRIGRELVVYLTPRIWNPQMETPLIRPDLPSGKVAVPFDKAHPDNREPK